MTSKDNVTLSDKFILDACCGGRMMWFNKNHPNCLYIDIRKEEKGYIFLTKSIKRKHCKT